MRRGAVHLAVALLLACAAEPARAARQSPAVFDVRAFGAKADGQSVDSEAINTAIEAAAGAGGGIVHFPAGRYLSFSIRLTSHVEATPGDAIPFAVVRDVSNLAVRNIDGVADGRHAHIAAGTLPVR